MPAFISFCQTAEAIGATASRLEKAAIIGEYFAQLPDDDLRRAALYFGGTPFPLRENRVVNIGGAALSSVTREVSGADADWLAQRLVATGDPGETAFEAWESWPDAPQTTALTLAEIEGALAQLAATRGSKAKAELVAQTLKRATALEAKYFAKMLSGDLRIGLKESAVEDALARLYQVELARVQRANMLSGDLGEVAVLARHNRLDEAVFELFHPLKFMLATPAADNADIEKTMPIPFRVEDKSDGIRAQAHIAPHRAHDEALHGENYGPMRVALFSRALNEITGAFPDLGAPLAALLNNSAGLVLDGEIVPLDENGAIAPFQSLQTRLNRKKPDAQIMAATPLAFVAYDVLFAGDNELELPLEQRRAILEQLSFDGAKTRLAASRLFENTENLDAEFDAARAWQRRFDDQRPNFRLQTGQARAAMAQSQKGDRHARCRGYVGRIRQRSALEVLLGLYLRRARLNRRCDAFKRRQSLFGFDRRRNPRTLGMVRRAHNSNVRARARAHCRAENCVGNHLRQSATVAAP